MLDRLHISDVKDLSITITHGSLKQAKLLVVCQPHPDDLWLAVELFRLSVHCKMAHRKSTIGWVTGTLRSYLPCVSERSRLGRTDCVGVCVHTSHSPCLTMYSRL